MSHEFKIETFSDYIENTIKAIENDEIVDYSISTMNLFARRGSLIEKFLQTLQKKGFKVYFDEKFTGRTYILPDGHYVFKFIPRGIKKNLYKKNSENISEKTRKKYADILVNLEPRYYQIETRAGFLRRFFSVRPLQFLSTSHLKIAPTVNKDGVKSVAILTGELSSESQQNNLSLSIESDKAYEFSKKLLDPEYRVGNKLHETVKLTKRMLLVADYGNYGEPWEILKIHKLALNFITHKPKNIVYESQYNPSGRMLTALNKSAKTGAHIVVPLQPNGDYRRNDAGFKFLFNKFKATVSRKIKLPTRSIPSHVKCLIIQHTDNSLSMIFGSDNFESWADSFYRNTEIALVIKRAKKTDEEYMIIQKMLDMLVKTGEISKTERERYW